MYKRSRKIIAFLTAFALFVGMFYGTGIHVDAASFGINFDTNKKVTTDDLAKHVKVSGKDSVGTSQADENSRGKDTLTTNAGGYYHIHDWFVKDRNYESAVVYDKSELNVYAKRFYTNKICFEKLGRIQNSGRYKYRPYVVINNDTDERLYLDGTTKDKYGNTKKNQDVSPLVTALALHFGSGWNWYNYCDPSKYVDKTTMVDITTAFDAANMRGYNDYALSRGRWLPCTGSLNGKDDLLESGKNDVDGKTYQVDRVSNLQKFILRPRSQKQKTPSGKWLFTYKVKTDSSGNVQCDAEGNPQIDFDEDGEPYVWVKPNPYFWQNPAKMSNPDNTVVEVPNVIYDSTGLRYTVYGVKNSAFKSNKYITGVTVKKGVRHIGKYAFWKCTNLEDITLSGGLEYIGVSAFKGTNIQSVVIPQSVKVIDNYAFMSCRSLKSVEISGADTTRMPVAINSGLSDNNYWIANMREEAQINSDIDADYVIGEDNSGGADEGNDTDSDKLNGTILEDTTNTDDGYLEERGTAVYIQSSAGLLAKDTMCLQRLGEKAFADTHISEIDLPSTCYEFDRYVFANCVKLKTIKLRYDGTCGKPLMIAPKAFSEINPASTVNFWLGVPVDKVNVNSFIKAAGYEDNINVKTASNAIYSYKAENESNNIDSAIFFSRVLNTYYKLKVPDNSNDYSKAWTTVNQITSEEPCVVKDGNSTTYVKPNIITAIQLSLKNSDDLSRFVFKSFNTKVRYHSATSLEDFFTWNNTHNSDEQLNREELIGNAYAYRIEDNFSDNNVKHKLDEQRNPNQFTGDFAYLNEYLELKRKNSSDKAIVNSGFGDLDYPNGTNAKAIKKEYKQKAYSQIISENGTLCDQYFERKGFTQIGWSKTLKGALNGEVDFTLGQSIKKDDLGGDGVLDLYAVWKKSEHHVILNYNDGTDKVKPQTASLDIAYNDKLTEVIETVPEREGYTFDGWYYEDANKKGIMSDRRVGADDRYNKEEDMVIYAKWVAKIYKVTIKQSPDEKFALKDIQQDGVTFKGANGEDFTFYIPYGSNYQVLEYKQNGKITGYGTLYDSSGNKVADATGENVPADISGIVTNSTPLFSSIKSSEKCNKDILGFVDDGGNNIDATVLCSTAENHDIYVKYDLHKYNISYNFNTGTKINGYEYPSYYTVEDYPEIPVPNPPKGMIFAGWYTDVAVSSNGSTTLTEQKVTNATVDKFTTANLVYSLDYSNATKLESSENADDNTIPSKKFEVSDKIIQTVGNKITLLDDGGNWVVNRGDIHLTAKYVPEELKITYEVQKSYGESDGTFDIAKVKNINFENNSRICKQTYANTQDIVLPELEYKDDTYEFKGWYLKEGNSSSAITDFPAYYDKDNNIELIADFDKKCTTVNYSVKAFGLSNDAGQGTSQLVVNNNVTEDTLKVQYSSSLYDSKLKQDIAQTDDEFVPADPSYDNKEYEFVGWYTDDSCKTPYKQSKIQSRQTLYAKFVKKEYPVVIKDVAGGVTKENLDYNSTFGLTNYELPSDSNLKEEDLPDDLKKYDKDYYVKEDGWTVNTQISNTDADTSKALKKVHVTGIKYSDDGLLVTTRDNKEGEKVALDGKGRVVVELDATYLYRTLKMDTDGGIINGCDIGDDKLYTKEYKYTEEFTDIPTPVKAGYKFLGWYDTRGNDNVTSVIATEVDPDGTTPYVIKAKWLAVPPDKSKETYNITYVKGIANADVQVSEQNSIKKYGEKLTLATAECEGFDFVGWYLDAEYTQKVTNNELSEEFNKSITLYAAWIPSKQVTEDSNEDVGIKASVNENLYKKAFNIVFSDNMSISLDTFYAQYVGIKDIKGKYTPNIEDPYKFGYKFTGWYTDSDYKTQFSGVIDLTTEDSVDLYPKFEFVGADKTPVSPVNPVKTNAPSGTENPAKTNSPVETKKPDTTKVPSSSDAPTTTGEPSKGETGETGESGENGSQTGSESSENGNGTAEPVTSNLKVKTKNKSLGVGMKFNVGAKSNTTIIYKSSNTKVATVTNKGLVTAKKAGTCTISIVSGDKTLTCKVTVKKAPAYVVITSKQKLTLKKGKTSQVKYRLASGSIGTVTFSTSNKKVATVSSSGKIKAKKKGKCRVMVKTHNGKKAFVDVTVK